MSWHAGHKMTHLGAGPFWTPSAVPSAQFGELLKAMSAQDIEDLTKAFTAATVRSRSAGLNAAEIQTSSDYLLGSFLNPLFNRRTDDYGGSLKNRVRLIVRVAEAVRAAAGGDLAVGVRTSIAHNVPGDIGGYGEGDSLGAMQALATAGLVDYVSLITGSHFALADMMPTMTAPPNTFAMLQRAFERLSAFRSSWRVAFVSRARPRQSLKTVVPMLSR